MTDRVLKKNQILLGDCVGLMRQLPDGRIPLTVTSPPYGKMRNYGGHKFDAEAVIDELARITRPGGLVIWVEQDQVIEKRCSGSMFRSYEIFRKCGLDLVTQITMEKAGNRCPPNGHYGAPEIALIVSKGTPEYTHIIKDKRNSTAGDPVKHSVRDRDGRLTRQKRDKVVQEFGRRGVVWRYDSGCNKTTKDRFAFAHPALMHEAMAEDLILSFSRPGDLVFDPMTGSGTTCKMALRHYRQFLGFEVHEPYVQIANARIQWARWEQQKRLDELEHGHDGWQPIHADEDGSGGGRAEQLDNSPVAADSISAALPSEARHLLRRGFVGETNLRQQWRTDPSIFRTLHEIFRFSIDACASSANALLPRYWTEEQNAAKQAWRGERVFCNPPFEGISSIIARASEAEITVMVYLLNALTARYFHRTPPNYILVPPKRLQFIPPTGLKASSNRNGTCLLVWGNISPEQKRQLKRDWLICTTNCAR